MKTEDIVQRCLEEVAAGRQTPAECAAAYPQVPDLLATLRAAEAFRTWPAPTLTLAATRQHEARLRAAVVAQRRVARPSAARRPALAFPRWALAGALIVALALGGVGTVRASDGSLPGQVLYPVKRAVENVQTNLTPAAELAARHMELADKRTQELQGLAMQGVAEPVLVDQAAREIGAEMAAALEAVPHAPATEQAALLAALLGEIDEQQAALTQAHGQLPPDARAGVERALLTTQAQGLAAELALSEVAGEPAAATGTPNPTATATTEPAATTGQPDDAGGRVDASATPKCTANSPSSPNYCTPTPGPTSTPPGSSGERRQDNKRQPNCAANSPNSPMYCTPTPGPTPTAPGNSGGNGGGNGSGPKCTANSPNSPNYCTPTPGPSPTPPGNSGGNGGGNGGDNGGGNGGGNNGGNGGENGGGNDRDD